MSEVWEFLEKRKKSRATFGLSELDRIVKGIHRHEIMTVGARTSHGKTVFALQLLIRWVEAGKKIALFSNEHSKEYVKARLVSQYLGGYTAEDILEVRLSEDDKLKCVEFWKYLDGLNLKIYDQGEGKSLIDIARVYHQDKPDIFIIDHVQMIKDEGYKDFRRQMNEFLNGIKTIVESNPAAVVLISQCGRKVAERRYFLPTLVDLKESGSLEDLSDIVLLMAWPWKARRTLQVFDKRISEEEFQEQEFFIDIAKNRNGKTEPVRVRFNTDRLRFEDWINPQTREIYP